jgi:hypothetical protein
MYVTNRFLCFYSNLFGLEKKVSDLSLFFVHPSPHHPPPLPHPPPHPPLDPHPLLAHLSHHQRKHRSLFTLSLSVSLVTCPSPSLQLSSFPTPLPSQLIGRNISFAHFGIATRRSTCSRTWSTNTRALTLSLPLAEGQRVKTTAWTCLQLDLHLVHNLML